MAYRAFGSNNRQFVENLKKEKVVKNDKIYDAFLNIDRGDFVPNRISKENAYRDEPIHSAPFHLSAVHIYSWALEALELTNNNKSLSFLNVGSGTGYFSYLVAYMIDDSGFCDGVEQNRELVDFARSRSFYAANLGRFKNVRFFLGDGYNLSASKNMKYDRIYIGASTKKVEPFVELLSPKGILVCPYNDQFVKIKKCSDDSGDFTSQILTNVRFSSLQDPILPNLQVKLSLLNDEEYRKEEEEEKSDSAIISSTKFVEGHGCVVSFKLSIQ